jgi:hypothetical protein
MSIQERWDKTFEELGRSCPPRRADETSTNYLRRLGRIGRKYIPLNEELANINFKNMPDDLVPRFSEMMREAVSRNAHRTDNMAPEELRAIVNKSDTGTITTFVGPDSFVRQLGVPCRRVTRISAPLRETVWQSRAHTNGLYG